MMYDRCFFVMIYGCCKMYGNYVYVYMYDVCLWCYVCLLCLLDVCLLRAWRMSKEGWKGPSAVCPWLTHIHPHLHLLNSTIYHPHWNHLTPPLSSYFGCYHVFDTCELLWSLQQYQHQSPSTWNPIHLPFSIDDNNNYNNINLCYLSR